MLKPQYLLPLSDELVVDNFAGGGGASTGIERAIGRPVDIAINHDPEAVAMHAANHPQTLHLCESVWDVNPREVTEGRPVGLAWFSPDCKHFSKAKGGKPVEKKIRGLAWVAVRWAAVAKPRIIMLENVEEFVTWGPLGQDGRPCPRNRGREFKAFVNALVRQGYAVEWRELRAADFGAPTSRKRLFLIGRRDGQPIVWPAPTHTAKPAKASSLKPWRTAAECIDWALACPSIFERERPLADATLRRVAAGIQRYVLDAAHPFIVRIGHTGHGDSGKVRSVDEPLSTITSKAEHLLISPTLVQTGYGEREGQAPRVPGLDKPLGTIVAGGAKHALVAAFLAKHYTGVVGSDLRRPIGTVTSVDHHSLVAAFLVKFYGSGGQWAGCDEPMHTLPTKDRMGLVTVAGEQYRIADIGLRMLQPRELAKAQGFPDDYLLEVKRASKPLAKHAQVRMIGNSVCPPLAEALVRANYIERQALRAAA
jgi:DNA (cytosine-5)-methyltransferase 1